MVLDVLAGAVGDMSGNEVADWLALSTTELPDVTPPAVTNVQMFFGTGRLQILADESLNADPATDLVVAGLFLSDADGAHSVQLSGATVHPTTGMTVLVDITEVQRVAALALSGTPGGDGSSVFLELSAGSISDISLNQVTHVNAISVVEHEDLVRLVFT